MPGATAGITYEDQYGVIRQPIEQRPNPPANFSVTLLADGVTVLLSVQVAGRSTYAPNVETPNLAVNFYFTAISANAVYNIISQADIANAFAKRVPISLAVGVPSGGGTVTSTVNINTYGIGVFWATLTNYNASPPLESGPAGPALLTTTNYQNLLTNSLPSLGAATVGTAILNKTYVLGSDFPLALVQINYIPGANPFNLGDGIVLYFNGYFLNQPGGVSVTVEGTFLHFDNQALLNGQFGGYGWFITIPADYDSSSATWLNIAHLVTMYLVPISQSHKRFNLPINTNPSVAFLHGIGS